MEQIGEETRKQSGLVIEVYGIENATDWHFALIKNVCATKNTRMKIIFTPVKVDFVKFVVPKPLTSSVPQENM